MSDPAVIAAMCEWLGMDGKASVAAANETDTKQRLRAQTEAALARGVFGVPSFTVDDKIFWGYDDLVNVRLYLDGNDPLSDMDLNAWRGVQPSAIRKKQ